MSGSKPGERRGGRRRGTPNKATAEIRALAQKYTEQALAELVRIATKGESEAARVSACKEILDRGHGRSLQSVAVEVDLSLSGLLERIDGRSRGLPKFGANERGNVKYLVN